MALPRPGHLERRQIRGRVFGEPATLIRTTGQRSDVGVWTDTEAETATTLATAPMPRGDPRVRALVADGVQLDAIRMFWLVEDLRPQTRTSAGDLIRYGGERYRVHSSERWGEFSEIVGIRQEGQGAG